MKTEVVMYRVRAYESFQKFETFNPNAGPIITRYFTVANNRESAVELRKHIRECELLSETRVLTADETCYLILGKIVDLNGNIVSGNDLSVHYYVEKQIELSIAGKKENIFATLDVLLVPFFLDTTRQYEQIDQQSYIET